MAYACDQADLADQVLLVRDLLRNDLAGAELFDVVMLSGIWNASLLFPFCPMLSQGWSLLQVKGVSLPSEVMDVRHELKRALWTTFSPAGMVRINEALKSGRLR